MFSGLFGYGSTQPVSAGNEMSAEDEIVIGELPEGMQERSIDEGWVKGGKLNVVEYINEVDKTLHDWSVEYKEKQAAGSGWIAWLVGNGDDDGEDTFDVIEEAAMLADEMMQFPGKGLDNDEFVEKLVDYLQPDGDELKRQFAVRYLLGDVHQLIKAMDDEKDDACLKKMKGAMAMLCQIAGANGLGDDVRREVLMNLLLSKPLASSVAFSYFNGLFSDPSNQSEEMLSKRKAFVDYVISEKLDVPEWVDENVLTTFIDLMPFPGLKISDAYIVKVETVLRLYMNTEPRPDDAKVEEYFGKFKLGFRGLDPDSDEGTVIVERLQNFEKDLSEKDKELYRHQEYPFTSKLRDKLE